MEKEFEEETNVVEVYSEKEYKFVEFDLEDEELDEENYECIGCSNADYGS